MSRPPYEPTEEQRGIIEHDGSAFVSACPGAGKTRTMVERARQALSVRTDGKALAFLSFTRAAISELQVRLEHCRVLPVPHFPHFVGTFDSFIWAFILAPLGVPGVAATPRLVPDLRERSVRPFPKAQELPLSCFARDTGAIIAVAAKKLGFDVVEKARHVAAYETTAAAMRARFRARGEIDFDDVREIVAARLRDVDLSARLAGAISGRFGEIMIDEAQDCGPDDLAIIDWLRQTGVPVKVICDPHQSIYGFRGGVTQELFRYRNTFNEDDRLGITGNFRSSQTICNALSLFRPVAQRGDPDRARGRFGRDQTPVYILDYGTGAVTSAIGARFSELVLLHGHSISESPIVAATAQSAANAAGQALGEETGPACIRLAAAICQFHHSAEGRAKAAALDAAHAVILAVQGHLDNRTYHQFLTGNPEVARAWRPSILATMSQLRYSREIFPTTDSWLTRARELIAPGVKAEIGTIGQRLRSDRSLGDALIAEPGTRSPGRTIHSVKGLEFPAVCVVLTRTAGSILAYLENGVPVDDAEEARKLYVAVSRAERLLVIAARRAQTNTLVASLRRLGINFVQEILA